MAGGLNFSGLNPFNVSAPAPMQIGADAQDYLGAQKVGQEAINGLRSLGESITSARQRQQELGLREKALVQDDEQFKQRMANDTAQFEQNLAIKQSELEMAQQQGELNRVRTELDIKKSESELKREDIKAARDAEIRANPDKVMKLLQDPEYAKTPDGQKMAMLVYADDPDRYLNLQKSVYEFGKNTNRDKFVQNGFAELSKPENKEILTRLNSGDITGFKDLSTFLNKMLSKGTIDYEAYNYMQESLLKAPAQNYNLLTQRLRAERQAASSSAPQNVSRNYTLDAQGKPQEVDPVTAGQLKMQGKPVYSIDNKNKVTGSAPKVDEFEALTKKLGL